MTTTPERKPPRTYGEPSPPGARRATYRPTSTTTSNAAPAAAAKKTTPSRSLVTKPPSQAPRIAGPPATTASAASRYGATVRRSASGVAIPSPSVTLWIMKPTTKNVPSASSPRANDEPIARPSPMLWRPIPIATSVASASPPEPPAPPSPSRDEIAVRKRKDKATPRSTSPAPPNALGSAAWSSSASESASTARNASSPAVSAMNAASHSGAARRSDGSHSSPSATGTIPTRNPIRPKPKTLPAVTPGVSTAAAISFVVWIPVELVTPTEIGSSLTQSWRTTISLERSRPSVVGPSTWYGKIASSTVTVAIVRSSRCGFVTRIRISPGWNSTRRMSNSSRGGALSPSRSVIVDPPAVKSATTVVSRTSGTNAQRRQLRSRRSAAASRSILHLEEPHPAELGELGLVRVEHEDPGIREVDLDDPALSLRLDDGVGVLELVARPGRVVTEEVAVEVEGVDEVELRQVREVDPNRLLPADADRVLRVVERLPVDGVEVVLAVGVGVVAVHHHDELLRRPARLLWIDDERAVEPLVDVLLQRRGVAVVEVHAGRPGGELVGEVVARLHDLEDAIHARRMDAVEMDRVRVRAAVRELDAKEIALGGADDRARNRPVVGPGVEVDPLGDLDPAVVGSQVVLADTAGLVRERSGREQEVVELVRSARSRDVVPDHRGMSHRSVHVVVAEVRRAQIGLRLTGPGKAGERRSSGRRGGGRRQPPPRKLRHA